MSSATETATAATLTNPALSDAARSKSCDAEWHGGTNPDCICSGVTWNCHMCDKEHPYFAEFGVIAELDGERKAVCAKACSTATWACYMCNKEHLYYVQFGVLTDADSGEYHPVCYEGCSSFAESATAVADAVFTAIAMEAD